MSAPRRLGRTLRLAACLVAAFALAAGTATAQADTGTGTGGGAGTGAGADALAANGPTAAEPGGPLDKITPNLAQTLETKSSDFWVRFENHADLTSASRDKDWNARGTQVAAALRAVATRSQSAVRAQLDRAGVKYESFWATNAIYVHGGSMDLAEQLVGRPEVDSLRPKTVYQTPEPTEGKTLGAVESVEWGIANIRANDVWEQYGVDGSGITVANIDTGVQYDHPALVRQYRGNLGNGTFDHNYNWFDAAGNCPGAPCDLAGHGTHTMGTMAGSDGGDNRIGVAPGVTWIAANGCCPSDEALIASAQWMLEPTDLAGQNPDASKRPNIINNSWGSDGPSNDPFMEDLTNAWTASGIFAMWSNGNNAPGCKTAGSPGSRIANYSAGAYDSDNHIASFSSRGVGQDGEIKPNISAPGVNVRSSVPGSRYASFDGTSMAAPHVAGTVALLWSAAPDLVGDVAATRELLDGTAVDTASDECGGTPADNNVYGEGRLDALALLDAAHLSNTGRLAATVTDAESHQPVADATVSVTGPVSRERTTNSTGAFSLPLPPGDYTVRVSAFGYAEQTAQVTVTVDETTTRDLGLPALPRATVSGRITDGSGHGWPLYAKITVDGVPGGTYYTRPADGHYEFSLPTNATYSMRVDARYPGYQAATAQVDLGTGAVTRDLAMSVDPVTCLAPGYQVAYDGAGSEFDTGLSDGWTVTDEAGTGQVWTFDDPKAKGNRTGGRGRFAMLDSASYGGNGRQDTSLVSPVADLSGQSAPVIGFEQDYDDHARDTATVELSIDGGQTWQTVLTQVDRVQGPNKQELAIPQAANQPRVRVRFHYVGSFDDYWQVDDAYVGVRRCAPVAGGLLLGHTRDRNTGDELNKVTVTSTDDPQVTTKSAATPDDAALADGFYWMFSPAAGTHPVSATVDSYQADTQRIAVAADQATQRDFRLPAGQLSVRPAEISVKTKLGKSTKDKFTVTNTGTAPATVEFSEKQGTVLIDRADGSTVTRRQVAESRGAPVTRVKGDFSPLPLARSAQPGAVGGSVGSSGLDSRSGQSTSAGTQAASPWVNLPEYPTRIMDNTVGELGGKVYSVGGVDGLDVTAAGYVYDPAVGTWAPIADLPAPRESAAGMFVGDEFYVTGGWGFDLRATKSTFAYTPATNSWRTLADAPVSTAAAGRAVLDGKLYIIGGCTNACDGVDVQRYDPGSDSWELLAPFPHSAGHLACAGLKDKVYCAGGIRRGGITWTDTYVYDPAANTWTPRASMPIPLWGMGYTSAYDQLLVSGGITGNTITNEGYSYDPDTDRWTTLPAANHVLYRGGSACGLVRVGGSPATGFFPVDAAELLPSYGACTPADVPWMSLNTGKVTLNPGEKIKVTVGLTGGVAQPGVYTGGVWIKEDTPYLVQPVNVTMTVTPRPHGLGAAAGAAAAAGSAETAAAATAAKQAAAASAPACAAAVTVAIRRAC